MFNVYRGENGCRLVHGYTPLAYRRECNRSLSHRRLAVLRPVMVRGCAYRASKSKLKLFLSINERFPILLCDVPIQRRNVCVWHLTDISTVPANVRFWR
jgi:hypothetical protein